MMCEALATHIGPGLVDLHFPFSRIESGWTLLTSIPQRERRLLNAQQTSFVKAQRDVSVLVSVGQGFVERELLQYPSLQRDELEPDRNGIPRPPCPKMTSRGD